MRLLPGFLALLVLVLSGVCTSVQADSVRYVPQLGLINLEPLAVVFRPNDDDTLLVVNTSGRIDILDISDPDRPFKQLEIQAEARSAAFNPAGDRIVSAGLDGTVGLWTLDGREAAEPFEGHDDWVRSVAFNPDGDRIVSAGFDGTVRLWTLDGEEKDLSIICSTNEVYWLSANAIGFLCSDRLVFTDQDLSPRGEFFLHEDGWAAILPDEGVYVSATDLQHLVQKYETLTGATDEIDVRVPKLDESEDLSTNQVRQLLFNQWSMKERILRTFSDTYDRAYGIYSDWESWWQGAFWAALVWALVLIRTLFLWIFAPARLAWNSMPVTGAPPPPPWKWIVSFYAFLAGSG